MLASASLCAVGSSCKRQIRQLWAVEAYLCLYVDCSRFEFATSRANDGVTMFAVLLYAPVSSFSDCPRATVNTPDDAVKFWQMFDDNPRPMRLVSDSVLPVDLVSKHGVQSEAGVITVDDVGVGGGRFPPYMLTNAAYTPKIFDMLADYPVPPAAAAIDLRPVFSIGLNGTGESDIGHHYHPITVLRLLQGRKIWALRSPTDPECDQATGTCTDPFDVCNFYNQESSPTPACVQEAGDTIIVPDGWYHGTCNNASMTVGWGGQGRRFAHSPPRCFHCRPRGSGPLGQLAFATTDEAALTASDVKAMLAKKSASSRGADGFNLPYLGRVHQAPYMAMRSLFHQFVAQTHMQSEMNWELRDFDCKLHTAAALRGAGSLAPASTDAHLLIHLAGEGARLTLRHHASGEAEQRVLDGLRAAFWVGRALEAAVPEGSGSGLLMVYCWAPMPHPERIR